MAQEILVKAPLEIELTIRFTENLVKFLIWS